MKQYKGTGMISPVFSFKMFHSTMRILLISFLFFTGVKQTNAQYSTRLINNWEFWKAMVPVKKGYPEEVPLWTTVSLPHCVMQRMLLILMLIITRVWRVMEN